MAVDYSASLAPQFFTFAQAGETEVVPFNAGSTTNGVLNVWVVWRERTNTISGVTFGPTGSEAAMTAAGAKVTSNLVLSAQLWTLANPSSNASSNINITMSSGTADGIGIVTAWVGNGAHQTATVDGYVSNTGSGTTSNAVSANPAVTSAVGDRVTAFYCIEHDGENATGSADGYVERQEGNNGGGITAICGDADGAASVSTTCNWTHAGGNWQWVSMAININAAGAGGNDLSVSLAEPVIGGSIF